MINVVELAVCCQQSHLVTVWVPSFSVNSVRICSSHHLYLLKSFWQSTPLSLKFQLFFSFITVRRGAQYSCCSSYLSAYGMVVGSISRSLVESASSLISTPTFGTHSRLPRFERELEALRKEIAESAPTNGIDTPTNLSRSGSQSDLSFIRVSGSSSDSGDNDLPPESKKD